MRGDRGGSRSQWIEINVENAGIRYKLQLLRITFRQIDPGLAESFSKAARRLPDYADYVRISPVLRAHSVMGQVGSRCCTEYWSQQVGYRYKHNPRDHYTQKEALALCNRIVPLRSRAIPTMPKPSHIS